jgi:hypothetical protein
MLVHDLKKSLGIIIQRGQKIIFRCKKGKSGMMNLLMALRFSKIQSPQFQL